MKYKIILLLLALSLSVASCEKFLDVKPSGKLIPTEVADLEKLMNHADSYNYFFVDNNRGCSYAHLGDNLEVTAGIAHNYYQGVNMDRLAGYIFYEPYLDPQSSGVHDFLKFTIYRPASIYNNVIDGIQNLSEEERNSDYAKNVTAQALASRGYVYMIAALVYGPMWDPAGANNTKVLPYRTASSPVVANPDLSTTADMLDKAWKDFENAKAHIPNASGNPTKPGKAALHAMRAQYHMYKRDWPNMLLEANAAWSAAGGNADNLLYDLNDMKYVQQGTPPADGTDWEVVLDLRYKNITTEPILEARGREHLYYRATTTGVGAYAYPSVDWKAMFDTAKDLRYKLFVLTTHGYSNASAGVNDGLRQRYYRGSKTLLSGGITYPEVLLMRAEAYARTNQLSLALADLNTLRRYRYERLPGEPATVTDHPNSAALGANQDMLLHEILLERRREQPIESHHRTLDIKRYLFDEGKPWCKTTITHDMSGTVYTKTLQKNSFTLTFDDITLNLNPHWGIAPYSGRWDPKTGF